MASVTEVVRQFETGSRIPVSLTDISVKNIPEEKGNKIHISKFLVLVNSNVATDDPVVIERLSQCLKRGFAIALEVHEEDIFKIKPPATDTWNNSTILSINSEMVTEVGSVQKRVHLHGLVTVRHRTILQMDSKAIRDILLDVCKDDAIKNLFVRIRFVPVSDYAEWYLRKAPVGKAIEF